MARMRKKQDLPSKTCAHCGLPFAWRKKWARDWDSVKYCSERCRRSKGSAGSRGAGSGRAGADRTGSDSLSPPGQSAGNERA